MKWVEFSKMGGGGGGRWGKVLMFCFFEKSEDETSATKSGRESGRAAKKKHTYNG